MQILTVALAVFLLASCLLASPAADIWHPPQAVPPQCSELRFEVLLFDVSRSMLRSGLFRQAQEDAAVYILTKAPECTLVIVGSFGVTADVRRGEFLLNHESRARLADSVRTLQATHGYTNLDEAAKLVELLSYQLRAAYGAQANQLVVKAYTDDESRPYAGKPQFSLAEYLAVRMNARHLRVSIEDTTPGLRLRLATAPRTPSDSQP